MEGVKGMVVESLGEGGGSGEGSSGLGAAEKKRDSTCSFDFPIAAGGRRRRRRRSLGIWRVGLEGDEGVKWAPANFMGLMGLGVCA